MDHSGLQKMSKLEKKATRLVRKAENRAMDIRRVVRAYSDAEQASNNMGGPARQLECQRQIEQAVMKYNQTHKAIGRLRRKIQLKNKDPRDFLRNL